MTKRKRTSNDLQSITQRTKDRGIPHGLSNTLICHNFSTSTDVYRPFEVDPGSYESFL